MRILPRRPSNSITHSAKPTAGDVISSRKAGGAFDPVRRSPATRAFDTRRFARRFGGGLADSSSRFSLPYSKRKAWAVGETPCSRASSTAADHRRAGIGKRPVCALRHRSKRRYAFCMLWGISGDSLAIGGPPCLVSAGRKTDVSNYGEVKSRRLAEGTR